MGEVDSRGTVRDTIDAFEVMLAEHPAAHVSAVTADGTPVPIPDEIRLGERHLRSGTVGMKAYLPQDRPTLIDMFDRTLREGYASGVARLLHEPTAVVSVHMFDAIERYGVILAVRVVADVAASAPAVRPDLPAVRPRLARIHKSRTAAIMAIDASTTEILGWTAEEMVGKRSLEFIHPDDQGLAIESWAILVTEPESVRRARIRHRTSDGSWRWFDVAHSAAVWQGEECFVADLIDVSEEMATQQALAAREQLLAQLAQALPLGVFQIDSDHRLVYTNDCLFEVTGSAGATDFDGLLRCVARDDRAKVRAALEAVMREGSDAELSVRVAGPKDDVERVCQFTLRRLTSDASARPGAVGCVVDITEQTTLRRELEDRATFDPLTRCYNRASIMSLLDDMLRTTTTRSGSGTAVLFIDFDRFKDINDRYGHHVGDEFLTAIAARIRGGLRDGAALGRIGGDEFLVVLPYIGSAREAAVVAQRLFESLQTDVSLSVGVEPCNASIGLAVHAGAHATAEDLVNQADAAMYEAKAAGGNRIVSATTNAA